MKKLISRARQLCFETFFARPKFVPAPGRRARDLAEDLELVLIWRRLRKEYFPRQPELDEYTVRWSRRKHSRTLASCNSHVERVSVAPAMRLPGAADHLEALLYHEMCHAALGRPKVVNGRRVIHGHEFKKLELRHPGIKALDEWIKQGGWRNVTRTWKRQQTLKAKLLT